jgi:hypothetical protein
VCLFFDFVALFCLPWSCLFASMDKRNMSTVDATTQSRSLAIQVPVPAENVLCIKPGASAAEAAQDYETRLLSVLGPEGALDVALLGMGPDGHTCSLFPGHALLQETTLFVAPIEDSPKPPPARITLTLRALHAARQIAFASLGEVSLRAMGCVWVRFGVASLYVCGLDAVSLRAMGGVWVRFGVASLYVCGLDAVSLRAMGCVWVRWVVSGCVLVW